MVTSVPTATQRQTFIHPQTNKEQDTLKVKYTNVLCSNLLSPEPVSPPVTPKGRLRSCLPFWKSIGANETVYDIILNGNGNEYVGF